MSRPGSTATTTERGYGAAHQRERARWQRRLDNGEQVTCNRCGQGPAITKDTPWDLGHNDDRTAWTGPEHPVCNRADGGRRSHGGGVQVWDW